MQDQYIYYIVQLQHLLEEADSITVKRPVSLDLPYDHQSMSSQPAVDVYVTQLKSQLEVFRETLPFALMESRTLMMQFHTAELYICQIGVCTDPASNTLPEGGQWPQWRLEILGMGLVAAKALLSFFLSMPLGTELNFNNSEWIQISFGITSSARLAILASQRQIERETLHLRRFLDMSDVLKVFIARLHALSTAHVDDAGDRDVFYHGGQRIMRLQKWYEAQITNLKNSPVNVNENIVGVSGNGANLAPPQPPYLQDGHVMSDQMAPLMSMEQPGAMMDDDFGATNAFDFGMANIFPDELDSAPFGKFLAFSMDGT